MKKYKFEEQKSEYKSPLEESKQKIKVLAGEAEASFVLMEDEDGVETIQGKIEIFPTRTGGFKNPKKDLQDALNILMSKISID